MVILDRLLFGGLRFVLDKVATAVDTELNDEGRLREDLLGAQMQHELGEIDDEEMAQIESDILERLREIRAARGEEPAGLRPGTRVVGVDISMDGSEDGG
ncbi:MAG TPA: gas vesicle protein GvpG [Thermoanaerobaculia bacterium]|nr:gas vesicle protein GvpG [Thermoanaerobaculia bacterium]